MSKTFNRGYRTINGEVYRLIETHRSKEKASAVLKKWKREVYPLRGRVLPESIYDGDVQLWGIFIRAKDARINTWL